ncbi:hypothetical protein Enr10x_51990 [Gimesia panareensis]|uniref:Uncharacterized protein n=1 Tax=Gimesia panareensis TaxID=2527978 RepID=A0A517QDX8_9PLAN|nr:hypothetical protein Enr10x_51990 [Gimesia panareensis]
MVRTGDSTESAKYPVAGADTQLVIHTLSMAGKRGSICGVSHTLKFFL